MSEIIREQTDPVCETTIYAREDGTADLLISARAVDGALDYWFIRDHGNGTFLLRYEGLWNGLAGGDEVQFPNHLLETPEWAVACGIDSMMTKLSTGAQPDGVLHLAYDTEYGTTGTLEEFYAYYAASGRYLVLLKENSIRIEGYTSAVPTVICEELAALNSTRRGAGANAGTGYVTYTAPEFHGPYEIFVTETAAGNTVRISRG